MCTSSVWVFLYDKDVFVHGRWINKRTCQFYENQILHLSCLILCSNGWLVYSINIYIYTLFKTYSMNKINVQALFKMHSFIDPPNSLQFFLIFLSSIFLYFHNFKNAGKEKAHNIKCYIPVFSKDIFRIMRR